MGSQSLAESTDILGVRVDDVPIDTLLERIDTSIRGGVRMIVVNANAHLVMLAQSRPWIRSFFRRADIAFCDGAGVQFAAKLLTGRMPHRHTPPQWIENLAWRLAARGGSVFWLGGDAETVKHAAERFEHRTAMRTAGMQHGFFDVAVGSAENEAVIAAINAAKPDLLLVNMGMPLQEQWLSDNWDRLNVGVAITAGALVDHVARRACRPPQWVANCGLEWAVRLMIEPRRLWRRYILGLPRFAALIVAERARRDLTRWTSGY